MLENFSNNDLKNIIDSAYRRFLLRSCNERISLFKFVFKLKISPQKLILYNLKKKKNWTQCFRNLIMMIFI